MAYTTRQCGRCGKWFTPTGDCNEAARPGCGLLVPNEGPVCYPCLDSTDLHPDENPHEINPETGQQWPIEPMCCSFHYPVTP